MDKAKNKLFRHLYIASCTYEGGIYQCRLYQDGRCEVVGFTQLDRPMYMTIEKRKMYILLRDPWGIKESGVIVYDIDENGALVNPTPMISTKGEVACHIMVHEENVYCANYLSGSLIKLPDVLIQHRGCGMHPTRQDKPHVHFVGITPDEKYICAADLGLDTIFLYDKNMKLYSRAKVPAGHGVRHLAFSEDKKYMFTVNELKSTVAAFGYDSGNLSLIDVQSAVPESYTGETTASAIRIKDGYIYVANRGHDTIAEMKFEENRLVLIKNIDCHGRTPRDFIFEKNHLICSNQDSDSVVILDKEKNFGVCERLEIPTPLCVCILQEELHDER